MCAVYSTEEKKAVTSLNMVVFVITSYWWGNLVGVPVLNWDQSTERGYEENHYCANFQKTGEWTSLVLDNLQKVIRPTKMVLGQIMMYIPFMLWSFASLRVHTDIYRHTLLISELPQNPPWHVFWIQFQLCFLLKNFFFQLSLLEANEHWETTAVPGGKCSDKV